jgi:cold shock protein
MGHSMSEERINGVCKWFSTEKGYGFIVLEGHPTDVFCHRQQLLRSGLNALAEGEKVSFVLNSGKKGSFATQISIEK